MDKRFAIFDMDGTLVDSMGYWARLGREYLEGRGVREGMEPVLAQIEPMTMLEAAALFLRSFGLSGTPEEAVAASTEPDMRVIYEKLNGRLFAEGE